MNNSNNKRETFSSGLAVFFATLGSAVGLGNIWKFPYMVGQNGGGAFVLIYLICIVLVGMPVMVSEFYIGRSTRKNAVGAFEALKVKPFWKSIGYMGVLSSLFIMFFYSNVAGWVYSYVFKALKGDFIALSSLSMEDAALNATSQYDAAVGGSISPFVWQIIAVAVVSIIIIAGVKKGIERITKTLLPLLFVLVLICCVRALTLEGAKQGLKFLFLPDFSKLSTSAVLSALGLAFFKLSLGMGTMTTYGSYFTNDNNLFNTSTRVALSDTLVSLLVGIAIFPVVFTFGMEPGMGPGLLFKTIPLVFSKIPFGNLLLVAFFILASIAATTAMLSLVEVPVAFFIEEKNMSRNKAVLLTSGLILLVGLLTVHPKSVFGSVVIGGKGFFDLFDYLSSNIMLPIGGLLISIFVGYVANKDEVSYELSNHSTLNNEGIIKFYINILRYLTPALLVIVFLNSIGIIRF